MTTVGGIDREHLKQLIQRIERLEEDKKAISDDISEVYKESKALGFDNKIIKEIVKLRKMDTNDRYEKETLVELYKKALNMESDS